MVKLVRPKRVSKRTEVPVDKCIAPLVQALNDAGIETEASCCGHGKGVGNIVLSDRRELFIVNDFETARFLDSPLIELVALYQKARYQRTLKRLK